MLKGQAANERNVKYISKYNKIKQENVCHTYAMHVYKNIFESAQNWTIFFTIFKWVAPGKFYFELLVGKAMFNSGGWKIELC